MRARSHQPAAKLEPPAGSQPGYRVTVARSIDEVESLRPLWERLQGANLPSDIDYFLAVASFHPAVVRPHVVLVEQADTDPCLLIGHVYDLRLGHRLGYWTPFRPAVRAINLYRGHLGDASPEALARGLQSLAGELDREADAILLRYLERGSPLFEAAVRAFPARRRQRCSPTSVRWASDIGATLEDTLGPRSRKTRENVRRIRRRMARDFGERAAVRIFRDVSEAEVLFRDVDEVAVKTYQTGFGAVYREDEFKRRLTEVGMRKGWYRAYVLYVDGGPVAFWTGYSYGGVFGWRGVTGYDPEYRSYSVGTYLLTAVLDDLSRDPDVHMFSLGSGDFPFKRFFGDRRWEEVDVRIFSSSPRGIWINVAGSAVHGLNVAFGRAADVRTLGNRVDALRRRRRRWEKGIGTR
ncbi:MAG: GNAT family N-acetyltransferase [Gaiellaceae bacterium]